MKLVNCNYCNKEFDSEIEGIIQTVITDINIVVKYYCNNTCKERDN